MKKILLLTFVMSFVCRGQTEQAWVFFVPKSNTEILLSNPKEFLSERSIARKEKYNISIDERDLPLNESYVNEIKELENISLITTSKWFNAVYVEGSYVDIQSLSNLNFVDSIYYMNKIIDTYYTESYYASAKSFFINNKFEDVEVDSSVSTADQIEQLNLDMLHGLGYKGEGLLIGVMDSGFINVDQIAAFDRAWDNGQIIYGYDEEFNAEVSFDENQDSHGTSVLSTMLGYVEGEFIGTAIDAQYALFKTEVSESESPQEEAFWIAAAEKADSLGVDILNTSLGYTTFDDDKYNYTISQMDGKTTFISQAATIALEKGMLPVVSAGNSGDSSWKIISAPADCENVLSIGAVDINGSRASFSSVGLTSDGRVKPDVVALGLRATVINSNGEIGVSSGTSFSGPIMAGAVACLWQAFPDKNAVQIMEMVKESGHLSHLPNKGVGNGIPDFGSFVGEILGLGDISENIADNLRVKNTVVETDLDFYFPIEIKSYDYQIFNISGHLIKSGVLDQFSSISLENLSSGIYIFKTYDDAVAQVFIKK